MRSISVNDACQATNGPAATTCSFLWQSSEGNCRLTAADCFDFLASLDDCSVDCVWTDPPYFLSNGGFTCVGGRMTKVDKGLWDRSLGVEQDHRFHLRWTQEAFRVLRPSGTLWVTGTLHAYLSVGMALLKSGFRLLNDIAWQKPSPPPNLGRRCFTHSTETILWATKAQRGSADRYTFHYQEMCRENGGKQMQTVWRFAPPNASERSFGKHPTQKPVALIARCLRASTNPGDLILDPFMGSGSTAVAALRLGRRFVGCDVTEDYVRMAVLRVEAQGSPYRPCGRPASQSGPLQPPLGVF